MLVSLANTKEPLYLVNRSGNRPSHELAASFIDRAVLLCRQAGFRSFLVRGDTDFTQTKHLDRWDDAGDLRFLFGIDARPNLVALAEQLPDSAYSFLERPVPPIKTVPQRPPRHKARIVQERGFETIHTLEEMVAEFDYQPVACDRDYRLIVLRKKLAIEKRGVRIREEYRYFFFITNDREMPADQAVLTAGGRCDQENLVAQLKGGVHALNHPGGQPGQQLGVHGHGQPGLELEGVGRVAGARDAPARPAAPDREANAVADGVQDVPCGNDRRFPARSSAAAAVWCIACCPESVAGCLSAAGGAAEWLLAVLSPANLKPGSGCPGPCRPSQCQRGWSNQQRSKRIGNRVRSPGTGTVRLYTILCALKKWVIYYACFRSSRAHVDLSLAHFEAPPTPERNERQKKQLEG